MNKKIKQYEEEYIKLFEEKLDRGEYEEEYMKSKVNMEGKIQQSMRKVEGRERRRHWWIVGKAAVACVAAMLVMAVSVPNIRAVAVNFLHGTLGLQITGVKEDREEESSRKNQGFAFEWLMQLTEKEYWEWSQAHEMTVGEFPAYVPEGFQEVKNDLNAYEYLYIENMDIPWSDKRIDPEDKSTYGRFGKVSFSSVLSKAERKEQIADVSVLCGLTRTWKKGQKELWYSRELYDIFELKGHEKVRENAAKKLAVGDGEAYLVHDGDSTWLYIFGETTLTKLCVDGEFGDEQVEKMLLKMAQSIQKQGDR